MDITIVKKGEVPDVKTEVEWAFKGEAIRFEFPGMARVLYIGEFSKVYISLYTVLQIHIYSYSGKLIRLCSIPEKKGYQFRGLNPNDIASTGVSLLYVPIESGKGNEWGDIEQYAFQDEENILGEFIGIYR